MFKELFLEGNRIKAGILGDFMFKKKYRSLGPALAFLKGVINEFENLGIQFVYTIPNEKAKQIFKRIDFKTMEPSTA